MLRAVLLLAAAGVASAFAPAALPVNAGSRGGMSDSMHRVVLELVCDGVCGRYRIFFHSPDPSSLTADFSAAIARGPRMQQMSEAIPFLEKPKKLDSSMPGYAGFDPLGFSDYYDVKWLQEAEIKHGRICMLAVVGMVTSSCGCSRPVGRIDMLAVPP
eukprot:762062-Hanusia_phi.AAC.4